MVHSLNRILSLLLLLAGLVACSTTGDDRATSLSLSAEPLTGKFIWHDLITDDVAAARKFYGALFGWTFQEAQRPGGGDYTLIEAHGVLIGGIVQLDDGEDTEHSRWLGYLSVADVDAAVKVTRAAGGSVLAGPVDLGNVGRAAAIQDPQGAVLGLLRSVHGDPDDTHSPVPGQIVWNELLAADDVMAIGFYTALSGQQSETRDRRGGEYTILRSQGRDRAGIMIRPYDDIDPVWLTYFAVADPQLAVTRAEDLGSEVILPPSPDLREGQMAVITDPNGALLALQKLPE